MVIRTVATIDEALFHLDEGDQRVYVDLDETIISTEPDASPYFERALNAALKEKLPALDGGAAFRTTCALWCSFQGHCGVAPVERDATARFLRSLRARGVEIVGLTARGPDLLEETAAQLVKAGVAGCFDGSSLGPLAPPANGRPPLFHSAGVVYCAGSRKPAAMTAYEARRPNRGRLVLVDDVLSHLEAMASAAGERPFLGLHYTQVAAMNPAYRDYEFPRLGKLLAGALANPRGRAFLRAAVDAVEDAATPGAAAKFAADRVGASSKAAAAPPRRADALALVAAFAAGAFAAAVLGRHR